MANKTKILIVDDDADLVAVMKGTLESKMYNVVVASNGKDGLKKAREENPDLVILDLMMPIMDGWIFAEEFHKDPDTAKIPVVAVSSFSESMGQPFPFEVAGFIQKPIRPNELLKMVDHYLKPGPTRG
jgi:CheY-like chemotaxis protein